MSEMPWRSEGEEKRRNRISLETPQVLSFLVLGIKSIAWSRLDRQPSTEPLLRTQGHTRGATGDCGFPK